MFKLIFSSSTKSKLAHLYLFFAILTLTFGCTRKTDENSSVSFTLPVSQKTLKSQAFSAQSLGQKVGSLSSSNSSSGFYIAINITSTAGSTFCSYDSHDQVIVGPCQFNIPQVVISIPQAKDTLFQVLFALDSSTGGSEMNYGEARQDISGSEATVELTQSQIGSGANKFAKIYGQYRAGLPNAVSLQTGLVKMKYKHSAASPAMTVMESEMFAGWMNLFAIENTNMFYEVDGVNLFPEKITGLSFNDFENIANISAPAPAVDDVVSTLRVGSTTDYYMGGFFGPGVLSSLYTTQTTIGGCSASLYSSCYEVTNSKVAKFAGPFRPTNNNGDFFNVSSNYNLSILPDVDLNHLEGVKVYKIQHSNIDDLKIYSLGEGRWNCQKISEDGTLVSNLNNLSNLSFPDPALASNEVLFACPYKGQRMFTAAVGYPEFINSFSRGGYQGPYLHLNVSSAGTGFSSQSQNEIAKNNCYQATIGLYEGKGTALNNSTGSPINISLTQSGSASLLFYSDNSCTSAISTIDIADTTNTSSIFYFKAATVGTGTIKYTSSTTPGVDIDVNSQKPILKIIGPSHLAMGECVGLQIQQILPLSKRPFGGSSSLNLSFETLTNLEIYDNGNAYCAGTPSSTVNLNSNNSSTYGLYVKRTGTLPQTIALASSFNTDFNLENLTIADRGSNSTQFEKVLVQILEAAPYYAGQCYTARVTLVNANNQPAPATSWINIPIETAAGDFFDSDCNSWYKTKLAYFNNGDSTRIYRFRPNLIGTITNFNSTGATNSSLISSIGFSGGSINISAPPSTVNFLRISNAPTFTSKIIGSHEFGTAKSILLDFPTGADIHCSESTDGNSWSNCAEGKINSVTKSLNWTLADAISGKKFNLRSSYSNQDQSLTFDPDTYYGIGTGSPFKVLQCDTTLPSSGTVVTTADINSAKGTVCINPGATLDMSGGMAYLIATASVKKSLIGWAGTNSDGSSRTTMTAPNTSGSSISMTLTATTPTDTKIYLANMILNATSNFAAVSPNSGAALMNSKMQLSNLLVKAPASGSFTAIYIFDNSMYSQVAIDDSVFELNDSISAVKILNNSVANNMGSVSLQNVKILNPTSSPNIKAIESISGASASNNIYVNNFKMLTPGLVLVSNDNSATNTSSISFQNCDIDISGTLAMAPFTINSVRTSLSVSTCRIKTTNTTRPTFNFVDNSVVTDQLNIKGNIFIKNENTNFFEFYSGGSTKNSNFNMTGNSFAKISNTAGGYVISNPGSSVIAFTDTISPLPASGSLGNKVCHTSASHPLNTVVNALTGDFSLSNSSLVTALLSNGACP